MLALNRHEMLPISTGQGVDLSERPNRPEPQAKWSDTALGAVIHLGSAVDCQPATLNPSMTIDHVTISAVNKTRLRSNRSQNRFGSWETKSVLRNASISIPLVTIPFAINTAAPNRPTTPQPIVDAGCPT